MTPEARLSLAADRLDRIAYGAHRGQSYSQTLDRVERLVPLLDGYPDLQAQVRAAVGRKGKSLGDRYRDLTAARAAVRAIIERSKP